VAKSVLLGRCDPCRLLVTTLGAYDAVTYMVSMVAVQGRSPPFRFGVKGSGFPAEWAESEVIGNDGFIPQYPARKANQHRLPLDMPTPAFGFWFHGVASFCLGLRSAHASQRQPLEQYFAHARCCVNGSPQRSHFAMGLGFLLGILLMSEF